MRKVLKRLLLPAIAGLLALSVWTLWFAVSPVKLSQSSVEFSIRPGSGSRAATRQMIDAGISIPAWQFNLLIRLSGNETGIKAGSYAVQEGATPWQILVKITRGEFSMAEVVFIEGWTFRQMRAVLQAHPALVHDSASLSDGQIMAMVGSPGQHPEGWFFPDTYLFAKGESDLAVLTRAHQSMQKQLQSAWQQRAAGLPLRSPYEALILASIVEKETGRREDRAMIAAVFLNRLRTSMRLQTDPTVIYGLGTRFNGNLRKRDLEADQPYNSYTRDGLPPSPIAMPGKDSLLAVMNPATTDARYFVSRGDGSSEFSRTLEQHNRAVRKYQLKR